MDCRTARFLLDFHRPDNGELPPDEVMELERHLAGCADCDAAGREERRFDQHLAPIVNDVPVPEGLKERLLDRLRDARGASLRRRLAWTARGVAVAAAVLVGVLLWLHYRVVPVPEVDIPALAKQDSEQKRDLSPEKVQEWFQPQRQVAMIAPTEFNYEFLVYRDLADVQGKQVPILIFAAPDPRTVEVPEKPGDPFKVGDVRANVYVFQRGQFDIDALGQMNFRKFESGNQKMTIWPPQPDRPDTAYVIFWQGQDLTPLIAARDRN